MSPLPQRVACWPAWFSVSSSNVDALCACGVARSSLGTFDMVGDTPTFPEVVVPKPKMEENVLFPDSDPNRPAIGTLMEVSLLMLLDKRFLKGLRTIAVM